MLTSRLAVADIQRFKKGAAPVVDVERLSEEAGAELLRDNDVWGVDLDLKAAAHDFGRHPLALTLLASLIKETQNGDVRRRNHIRGLLADADNPVTMSLVRLLCVTAWEDIFEASTTRRLISLIEAPSSSAP